MAVPNPKWQPGTGKQVILKSDFLDLEGAIVNQGLVRMQPPLTWVNGATVRVEATADCVAAMQFTGLPNILNPSVQVSGGLCDGIVRTVTTPVTMNIVSSGLYGTTQTEKVSQWYAVYAIAADVDTTFTLKCLPFCRVKSQSGKDIKCGTNITPATGINYGFTNANLVGGMVYFISGSSKGLIREITANVVDTDTKITYTGDTLTVAAGDWFYILPPTNFRLVGAVFNNYAADLRPFSQSGNRINWLDQISSSTPISPYTEDITVAPPIAIALGVMGRSGTDIGHPDGTNYITMGNTYDALYSFAEVGIKECKYKGTVGVYGIIPIYYKYPPGCGY
jgi:hypothetical protein